jgi:predicted anti-sigma-YlaC factor YlaD
MNEHLTTEQLIDYLHRELEFEGDAVILTHLDTCAECRAQYDSQAQLSELLRAHARATERELPQSVITGIWDTIEARSTAPSLWERITAAFRPAYAIPIAAAVVVGAYFGITAGHHGAPKTIIDAAYYLEDHAALTSTMPFAEGNIVPTTLENDEQNSDQQWVATNVRTDITTADAGP